MTYKLVSCNQVISKVMADLDIQNESIRISDWISWCGEAIEKIGAKPQLETRISGVDDPTVITLVNSQAALPNNLYKLNQAVYSLNVDGPWVEMRTSTSSFGVNNPKRLDTVNLNQISEEYINRIGGVKYIVKPGFIVVNMLHGYIKLSYDALACDDNGYPMIPDLVSYMEAIYWYIVMKLKYPEYMSGKMRESIYYDIRRSWNFYCKQAYGDIMMPTVDDMESIKNTWMKIIPENNSHGSFFELLANEQYIRSNNRR
jgi:hypothetical protein